MSGDSNVTVRETRASRRRGLGLESQGPTPAATADSESGECGVRPGEPVVRPGRTNVLSSPDNVVAEAQSREQEDASVQESGKRAADASLLVELSPAAEHASSGSADPAQGSNLTETDGELQGRNRKRPKVPTDPALGSRFSTIQEDQAETDTENVQEYAAVSAHPAEGSGRGTHPRTPPTVEDAGLAPPKSGVDSGTDTSVRPPLNAVGNQGVPAQQLEQTGLPQADSGFAASARDQGEETLAPLQQRPETNAESHVEPSGTHRGPDSMAQHETAADRSSRSGTHREGERRPLSGGRGTPGRRLSGAEYVLQLSAQSSYLDQVSPEQLPGPDDVLSRLDDAESGLDNVPPRPLSGPDNVSSRLDDTMSGLDNEPPIPPRLEHRREVIEPPVATLPVPVPTQPELIRMDIPGSPGIISPEELEQWRQHMMSGELGVDEYSRRMSHPEEGTRAGVLLSPCPDSPPPEIPSRLGEERVHLEGVGGGGAVGQTAQGPGPSVPQPPPYLQGGPPPYEGSGPIMREEFEQLKALVEGMATRQEFTELSQSCQVLQEMSLEASRQRQRSEVRLTGLEDAAKLARIHNEEVTKRLTAMEAASRLTCTTLQNLVLKSSFADAQTAKMCEMMEAAENRRKAEEAAAAAAKKDSATQAEPPLAPAAAGSHSSTRASGAPSQGPSPSADADDEGFGESSPTPDGERPQRSSTPNPPAPASGGCRPKDPKPPKESKPSKRAKEPSKKENETFSLPEGCTPQEAEREWREFATRNCPRYSEIFPAPAGRTGLMSGNLKAEEAAATTAAPPAAPKVAPVVEAEVVEPVAAPVAAPAAAAAPVAAAPAVVAEQPKPKIRGVPKVGSKAVWEHIGFRYGEDTKDRTLKLFISKIEDCQEDEGWDDEQTALGGRSALTGKAYEFVAEMRGTPGFHSWIAVRDLLIAKMYGTAERMSAETSLEKITREQNETLTTFGKRIMSLVNIAYFNETVSSREEKAIKAFLGRMNLPELELRLRRERLKRTDLTTLRALISEGEAEQNLEEKVKGGTTKGSTIARVAPPDGNKSGRQPFNSGSTRGRGRGRKKGPKPVAPFQQRSSAPDGTRQIPPCRGKCWRCGTPGHRYAECPGGRVCSAQQTVVCPKGEGTSCECECSGHTHFGYGER